MRFRLRRRRHFRRKAVRNIVVLIILAVCVGRISAYSVNAETNFDDYYTVSEAGEILREAMVNREAEFEIKVKSDSLDYKQIAEDMTEAAMIHTGNSVEGDYLKWHYNGWTYTATRLEKDNINYYIYDFSASYYTSAEQENDVTMFLNDLMPTLITSDMSSYERVCAIYDYICNNVVYDESENNDLMKYTAYGALINKSAVCQGYSSLFYTMSLMAGVDARMVYGVTDKGEGHMWNIVRLGDCYYNADVTWDSELAQSGREYEYFLKSDSNFVGHTRNEAYCTESFYNDYPMAETDYTNVCQHTFELISQKEADCENDGECTYQCTKCGTEMKEKVPSVGHSYNGGIITKEPTCTEQGIETYTCKMCGKTYNEKISELGHDISEDGNYCKRCGIEFFLGSADSEMLLSESFVINDLAIGESILYIVFVFIIGCIAIFSIALAYWKRNAD